MLARQKFCQGQEQVYRNTTAGWTFWSAYLFSLASHLLASHLEKCSGYMKEGCDTDLDWCFKNAVNRTLPATFFSYGPDAMASPSSKLSVDRAVAQMQLPSMNEVLQQAADASPGLHNRSMSIASSSARRRRNAIWDRTRIGSRRFILVDRCTPPLHGVNATFSGIPQDLTAEERSITKGYSDGYLTAKIFTQYGMSKTWIRWDSTLPTASRCLDRVWLRLGTETFYSNWFRRGSV